ncbi:hypothetical protein ACEN85_19945, partial [Curtobacterium sp. CT11-45]
AASAAGAAHVPVLLTGKDESTAQDEAPGKDESTAKGGSPAAHELERLGARWYQAEGDVRLDTDVPEQDAPDGGEAPEPSRASRQATV